jgi:hypothetical protein
MSVLIGVGAALVLLVVSLRIFENRLIYFPPRYPEGFSPPKNLPAPFDSAHPSTFARGPELVEGQAGYSLDVEDVWLTTRDNVRLNAWYLANPASPKALVWFHGNAENIADGLAHLKFYSRLGLNVLALDYRGYGRSAGSPDEAGIYRDADAAYDYLVETRHIRSEDVVVLGHSLGGAVAIDLASRRKCGALIVESSFTSGRDMARRMFWLPLLEYVPKSRFDSLAKLARAKAPVLVVHGTRDRVIPFSMGQRLFEAASEPKFFFPVEGAGHDDVIEVGGEHYLERLKTFIDGKHAEGR